MNDFRRFWSTPIYNPPVMKSISVTTYKIFTPIIKVQLSHNLKFYDRHDSHLQSNTVDHVGQFHIQVRGRLMSKKPATTPVRDV